MRRQIVLGVLLLAALVSPGVPTAASSLQDLTCFEVPQIVDCIDNPDFDRYWNGNGGLPVFGYPVSPQQWEYNQDAGDSFGTQWFERNRLEAHPENQPPYHVLLGRLGAEMLALQGRRVEPAPVGARPEGRCRRFDVGGHEQIVCDPFLRYWETHGLEFDGAPGTSYSESLALFGLPLTYPRVETNPNGDTVRTQWFERARFEDHGRAGVLLGLLGVETLRTPAPGKPVVSIVDGDTGLVLGGSRAGVWVGTSMAAAQLRDGTRFQLYTLGETAGQAIGSRPQRETGGPCSWVHWVRLNPQPFGGAIGIAAPWNVRPRAPVELGTNSNVYRNAVADILRAHGIVQPDVRLTRVLRVDLEGDGVDEVVLTAARLIDGSASPRVAAGDYVLALVRKVIDGQVHTIILDEAYYLESSTFVAPAEPTVNNLLDLNGDNRLEIVLRQQYYEGFAISVHDVVGQRAVAALREGCGV